MRVFTIIQGPLQNGRRAAPSVSYAREGQDLDLIQDVLAQTAQLDAVAGVALHCPEVGSRVRILLLKHDLKRTDDDLRACVLTLRSFSDDWWNLRG